MKFVQKAALIIAILLSLILVFSAVHAFPQDTTADIDTTGDSGNIRFFKSTFLDSVDLDNDGKAEIILNNLDWGEYTDLSRFNFANGILNIYQLSGGSLKQKSSISANTPFGIAYGNFDGEGGLDIVTITVNPQGGHTITRLSAPNWNIAAGVGNFNAGRPTAIAAGDFVGDGLDDIVIGVATVDGDNLKSPKFLVCENQDGTFNCDTTIDITQDDVSDPIYDIAVGDIGELQNGNYAPPDTRDDIVLVTRTGRVVIQYQNSIVPKTFNSKQLVQAGFGYSNTKSVEIGDINGDDLNDIVVGNSDAGKNSDGGNNPDNVVAYFHVPGIGFGFDSLSVMDLAGAGYPIDLEIGDIDQDGLNDVVVVNGQGTKINIFLQNEQNRLPSNPSYSLTTDKNQVFGIGIGDLDGDHLTDISAVTVTGNLIHAFLQENNPPEILEMAVTPSLTSTNFAVSFMAEVSDVEDNLDLTTVSWSSSIDKDLSLSDLDSEYQGLSVGVHDITFEVCDLSGGCSSKTLEAAVEIYPGFDGVPQLANPPILPRLSTVSESIYTYNQAPCPTAGIAQQGATAGTIEINASINENRVLSFTTTEDIIGDGSGAKYQVYLKNNCELTPIGGLVSLEPSLPDVYKKFNDVIAKPACSQDECEYVVEIMAHSKGDVGGTVETFTFIPTIEGESLNAVSGKAQYLPNEVALIRAIATTDEMLSVTYTFDYPESMRGTSGRMSYSGVKKEYRAYVPLGEAGSYVIDITARLINEPTKKLYKALSFDVVPPAELTVFPQNVSFINSSSNRTLRKTVTVTNNNNLTIEGLNATLDESLISHGLIFEFENTTLGPSNRTILNLNLTLPFDIENGNYTGVLNLTASGVETKEINVKYIAYNRVPIVKNNTTIRDNKTKDKIVVGKLSATLNINTWSLGTISPGASVDKTIIPTIKNGQASDYTVDVLIGENTSEYIFIPTKTIDLSKSGASFKLEFGAPMDVGKYVLNLDFEFKNKKDGSVLDKIKVPVTFEVSESGSNDLIDDAKSRLNRAKGSLGTAQAKAGAGTSASLEIQGLVSGAEQKIREAERALSDAENAMNSGDSLRAEDYAMSANVALGSAEDTIFEMDSMLSATAQANVQAVSDGGGGFGFVFIIIIIIIIILVIVGLVILALREGWLPADKVPWLKDAFDKIGIGSLVESSSSMEPDFHFTPTASSKPARTPLTKPMPGRRPGTRPVTARPGVPARSPAQRQFPGAPKQAPIQPQLPPGAKKKQSYYNKRFQQ